jgi:hypothetical protein
VAISAQTARSSSNGASTSSEVRPVRRCQRAFAAAVAPLMQFVDTTPLDPFAQS